MRNSSNLNDLMMSLAGKTDSKLGFTTTVKEQVDDIEVLTSPSRSPSITSKNHSKTKENNKANYKCNSKN